MGWWFSISLGIICQLKFSVSFWLRLTFCRNWFWMLLNLYWYVFVYNLSIFVSTLSELVELWYTTFYFLENLYIFHSSPCESCYYYHCSQPVVFNETALVFVVLILLYSWFFVLFIFSLSLFLFSSLEKKSNGINFFNSINAFTLYCFWFTYINNYFFATNITL